jgi:hypothetical protein
MTGREKWKRFLAGDDVGPMVCPLCDKWNIEDIKFEWDGPKPDFIGPADNRTAFLGQIMMAKTFGWDPVFYARIDFRPKDKSLEPVTATYPKNGKVRTVSTIKTPLGDLTRIDEVGSKTQRCIKDYLETEADYEKMIWYTAAIKDFKRDEALAEGRSLRGTAGDLGMIGTWASPSAIMTSVEQNFYHLMDYPDAYARLRDVKAELTRLHLEVYRESGFDFMFYCVSGTDTISPGFYGEWMEEEIVDTVDWWRSTGGFTLWHSCGHVRALIEKGVYNKAMPEIFETLSEPPVGNLPSLSWARERLDPGIVTKGNIPLDILLEGTEYDVREAVRRVKNETAGYRHIIGLSDNILNGTPSANLRAYVEEGYRT